MFILFDIGMLLISSCYFYWVKDNGKALPVFGASLVILWLSWLLADLVKLIGG